ncbi:MAG TPA: lipoate protein ligase C-terminal domain-containing protein, partial [Candidatus Cloacimonadota bacterium]|nr:lipoate protein ligase C-terminal domain-containing protein [Candidatus Cloacimonadota bacterium]
QAEDGIRDGDERLEARRVLFRSKIESIRGFGDFFSSRPVSELETALKGLPHEETALRAKLAQLPLSEYFGAVTPEEILSLLF